MRDVEYLTTKRFFKVVETQLGLKYNKEEQDSVVVIIGKKVMEKTIFDLDELQLVFQNLNEGLTSNLETINKIDFSKVSTKAKRFINRMREYLEKHKVNIVEALGN
jgi:hypothetical protein